MSLAGALALACACPHAVSAAERYALVVSGASGGAPYARQFDEWRTSLADSLVRGLGLPAEHLIALGDTEAVGVGKATRENVRRALASLAARTTKDDVSLVVLIGHGTGVDADEARFNLVGPDLTAGEWADLVRPVAGRLVFVNTAGGSFPFLEALSGRERIVITANDSAAQLYDTVFAGYFVLALVDASADADRNGRVSIWEAFAAASAAVARWYEQRGQLVTERALLDDNGDGIGREAGGAGLDGPAAMVTYLQGDPPVPDAADPELARLLERRRRLERELEELRARKPLMRAEEYEAALERILLELAQVGRRIRGRS
jgi:hypothetical protein